MKTFSSQSSRSLMLVLLLLFTDARMAVAVPWNWKIFGDSISAGFLAATSLVEGLKRRQLRPVKFNLIKYKVIQWWNPDDSQYHNDKYNNPELAWPYFLAAQFSDQDQETYVENYAVSGAETKDLAKQIDAVKADDKAVGKSMVFIWIGHNDLLARGESLDGITENYEKQMRAAIAQLNKKSKATTIILVPIIDITEVYAALDNHAWGSKRGLLGRKHKLTCEDTWKKFLPYWRFFPRKGKEKSFDNLVKDKVKGMNAVLGKLAQDFAADQPQSNGNSVIYLEGLFTDIKFEPEQFSEDCFHPSEAGQHDIADRMYEMLKKQLKT